MYFRSSGIWPVVAMAVLHGVTNAQTISPGGIVNAAGFQAPVAPGSVIAIFGTSLSSSSTGAAALPLPTALAGTSLLVNGRIAVPLFYVSPGQINVVAPNVQPGLVNVTVTNSQGTSAAFPATAQASQPLISLSGI